MDEQFQYLSLDTLKLIERDLRAVVADAQWSDGARKECQEILEELAKEFSLRATWTK